ncbi:GNAT family N-acetyltransferase [Thermomonospora cellulosilytica]|uniref:Ribosomal protein S18 acetylase RimI-like enzyme n=1 Tax=Thermomonospora cellulosilytica TaxID=1411118 RepID=A0A7W3R6W6_9ACTN|nr:GNAT family N-acetyltransferase [Thermomonospora cellulosilytica]MBA9001966.1 ribosomal protein S18 acetylase RimI-like enzyme [Thermomonospora cellulosilytica]
MEIRTFTEADRDELRALFERAGEGSPSASLWGHMESEAAVYLYPYMEFEPDSLLIAVDGGAMVGYLTGCLDSSSFPDEAKLMEQAIRRHRLLLRPRPMAFFARSMVDAAWAAVRRRPTASGFEDERWPAHLHINVAPEARGKGAADGLMRAWQDRLRQTGSPGCHLQTLVENTRAVRFFERMGFVRHGPTPLVPGVRYQGRRVHQQTMVWTP